MTKQELQQARTRLEQERENPFKAALSRLADLAKSRDVNEEELDDNLFAAPVEEVEGEETDEEENEELLRSEDDEDEEEDDDESDDDDDEDEDFFGDDDDDEEDDEDEEEDDEDEDEGVTKSLKASRRSQSLAISDADQREAHSKVHNAKNKRARNEAELVHAAVNNHFDDLDDDEVDEGEDDVSGSADAGTAKKTKRSGKRAKVLDQHNWNVHKSEDDDDEDFGIPEGQEKFIEAVLKSGYAQQIDASAALRELAEMFGSQIAIERAVIGDVAKSYEALGDIPADIQYLKESVGILAAGIQKSLAQQEAILARFDGVNKSINHVQADVELVKSQPVSGAPLGVIGNPPVRVDNNKGGEVQITKRDIHGAISKSLSADEITTDEAYNFMAKLDSPLTGIEGVYNTLPEAVRARVESH